MAQQSSDYLNHYNQKIQFLQSCGSQVLQSILMLEIGMNRRKHQNEQVHPDDLNRMYLMTRNFLQMLSEIKTCQYLKTTHKLVNFNDEFYITTCDVFFKDFVRRFNTLVKADVNNEIDFSINS